MALKEYKTMDLEECMKLQEDGVLLIGINTLGHNPKYGKESNQLRQLKEFTFLVPEKEKKKEDK